ncbi:VQ motif-containing protein 9-like [Cornus florida]|uniref:VQ motif-containing protein 9-like n=1 Tax=Cornus florida TaxID=4283 RepID=UPI002897ACBB|nr:VQ motif-containing protein 9-like [Cornus florida]
MDKSCHSSGGDSSSSSSSNNRDYYLKHLNKISHKISKPVRRPTFDHINHPPPPPPPLPPQSQPQNLPPQQQQHQPPVYNINKSDFRDIVQKLTGSPAHERFSTPPPIQPPKPPSSRLQRIRPPPLAHLSNRPPPLLSNAGINPNTGGSLIQHQRQPLSPLPPFPAVHAAAESPVSAYMRYLQGSVSTADSDPKRLSPFSPRWSYLAPPQLPQHQQQSLPRQQNIAPSPTSASMAQLQFPMPSSPLPFACFPSPRSPYPFAPNMLFSPTTAGQLGFQQFPVSPTVPVPSPRWKDV